MPSTRDSVTITTPSDTTPSDTTASDTTASDTESEGGLTIDCDCCTLRDTTACDDCVVSFLLGREPDDAVVIDADEARAMRMLERAGLVPTLRFTHQAG
jgi:hypothetical protein